MTRTASNPIDQDLGTDRSLALYGVIFGLIGSFGILFFWIISAILLVNDNGGLINQLNLEGVWLTGYWAYPFVALGAALVAGVLFLAKRDGAAVAAAGAPVGLVVLYYLVINVFRGALLA